MIDLLIRFPSRIAAVQFGNAAGYTSADPDQGDVTIQATSDFAICVIGDHYLPSGNMLPDGEGGEVPEMVADGFWWVLFRAISDIPVPAEIEPLIVWRSDALDSEGDPLPRPADAPSLQWM